MLGDGGERQLRELRQVTGGLRLTPTGNDKASPVGMREGAQHLVEIECFGLVGDGVTPG